MFGGYIFFICFLWHLFLFLVKQVQDSASKGVEGEEVFSEAKSLLFKSVKVVGVKTSRDHLFLRYYFCQLIGEIIFDLFLA